MARSLYVPVDVNFGDDPKVLEAGPDAEFVYLRSLLLAKRIGGDGHIHRAHLFRLASDLTAVQTGETTVADIAGVLVKVGLWVEVPDGWQIAAWLKHNPSDAELEESRQTAASRKAKWRESQRDTDAATEMSHGTESRATLGPSAEVKRSEVNKNTGDSGSAAPDARIGQLVGGYVEDYESERSGHSPSSAFKGAAGRAIKSALRDGESPDDIARCLGVIAHEGKNPSTLPNVLADFHAGRERRMR